jgi:hypothetical protein
MIELIVVIAYVAFGGVKLGRKIKKEIDRPFWKDRCYFGRLKRSQRIIEKAIHKYFKWPIYDPSKRDPRYPKTMAGFYWIRR